MVSSNLFRLVNSPMRKIRRDTLSPPHHVSSFPSEYDSLELDFADVFGTLPSSQLSPCGNVLENSPFSSWNDDPVAIQKRSHSLVGPSSCSMRSLSFDLHELTLHESEEADVLDEPGTAGTTNAARPVGLDDFEIMKVVGQGAFGRVYQVRKKGSFEIYAMKVIRKDKIVEKNHAEYMKSERDILTRIDHPFIVRLRYSFQTKYRLYLVLDFINGGHLFFQLYRQGLFREDLARIYTAEIVAAVAHLHANGIMHRDLKPENILLDADGHAMLTDFGLAKRFEENTRSNSLCGTVEYMSPEIIQGKGHDKAADWWSVGVLLFEMLTGRPPFVGGNRAKIQQKIIKEKIKLPSFLSSEAHSLLKGLLQKDASKRLGSEEIRGHKWFRSVNWKRVEARELQPSFRPDVAGKHCIANFDKRWTDMPLSDSPVSTPTDIGMNTFMGFSYSGPTNRLPSLSSSSSPAMEK